MRIEHALDAFEVGAEPLGDFGDRADEISGLIQPVDQRGADHPLGRIGKQDRGLTLEMVAKRQGLGDIGFEVRGFARVGAGADPRPGLRAQVVGSGGLNRRRGAVRIEGVFDLGAKIGGEVAGVRFKRLTRPVAGFDRRFGEARGFGVGLFEADLLTLLRPLEQRIARQFVLDELGQFEIRHLQQLDRLQKLRRQNHRLTLPQRQFDRKRHTYRQPLYRNHVRRSVHPCGRPRLVSCLCARAVIAASRPLSTSTNSRRFPRSIVNKRPRLRSDVANLLLENVN